MLGLYSVLWGKNEENKLENQEDTLKKSLLDGSTVSDIPWDGPVYICDENSSNLDLTGISSFWSYDCKHKSI